MINLGLLRYIIGIEKNLVFADTLLI